MRRALLMAILAAPCFTSLAGEPATSATTVVLTKQLQGLGAQVFWTRRTGYCSLQIMMTTLPAGGRALPIVGRVPVAVSNQAPPVRKAQSLQVWMLRADGTVIAPLSMSTPVFNQGGGVSAVEYNYTFAPSVSEEAIAVAMMLNGRYTIQRLTPFAAK